MIWLIILTLHGDYYTDRKLGPFSAETCEQMAEKVSPKGNALVYCDDGCGQLRQHVIDAHRRARKERGA
jgi:hypothetical protein